MKNRLIQLLARYAVIPLSALGVQQAEAEQTANAIASAVIALLLVLLDHWLHRKERKSSRAVGS